MPLLPLDQRAAEIAHRAQQSLQIQQSRQRRRLGPLGCARRDFAKWMRSGATPLQAARVALAVFRAHS